LRSLLNLTIVLPLQEKFNFLKHLPIFSEASDEVLFDLASSLKEKEVPKGATIIRKGDIGEAVFMISSGKVRIHDGNHVLARMEKGQLFGEYALIDRHVRSASVTAEDQCLLLQLDNEDFYRIAAGDPGILRGVLRELIRRIREMNSLEEKLSKSYLKIQRQNELIEKQNESITQQKTQLEQQNFDLTKLNEEKNQLISLVIHQIKNPLTSALCMAEMLDAREGNVDETEKQGLAIIRNSMKRINNLVNEILDISAIESKVYQLKVEPLELNIILEELIENYKVFIEQKNISLQSNVSFVAAKLNRVYVTQIFDNLLSNAVKFSPESGRLKIKLEPVNGKVLFSVQDQGPGIEEEKAKEIFEKYRRQTPMTEQDHYPEGLGLAIVYKYTTALEGEVKFESSVIGTTFTVELPLELRVKN
jgi:signal transduction histidine kinase